MYKIKIIKKDDTDRYFKTEPVSYRVSITFNHKTKEIEITREYFRVGFRDGEKWDGFYFDMDMGWKNQSYVNHASIMTRRIANKKYLQEIEERLIKEYYKRCHISANNAEKELSKTTSSLRAKKKRYLKMIDTLDRTFRKEKIKRIINEVSVK